MQKLFPDLPTSWKAFVQRWPHSLPQYELGHEERVREIEQLAATLPGLALLGNAYRGVGLPDMVHRARTAAHSLPPE
jgi:oxygen-dependent protoporphyrinogen oxidase